jgi:hypothetical protein
MVTPTTQVDTAALENLAVAGRPVLRPVGVSPFETDFRQRGAMNADATKKNLGWVLGLTSLPFFMAFLSKEGGHIDTTLTMRWSRSWSQPTPRVFA